MGTASGAITMFLTKYGLGSINLGTAVETSEAWIETKPLDFGRGDFVKFLEKVIANVRGRQQAYFLMLQVYGSDDEEGPFELLDEIQLALEDPAYTDPPGQRFYKFRFADSIISTRWALHGFSVFGEFGGDEF